MSKIWLDGELVDADEARVHVLTPSLHCGWAVVEGMRAYATDRGPAIFQHRPHVERLVASAAMLAMDIPYRPDELMEAARQLCRVNGQDSYFIRPLVFLGAGEVGADVAGAPVRVAIAVWPWDPASAAVPPAAAGRRLAPGVGAGPGDRSAASGVRAAVSSWVRTPSTSVPAGATVAGAAVSGALAKLDAVRAGYDAAILLNQHGRVAEGAGENVFVVKDGVLLTPPPSEDVLRGITRDAVLDLARDRGVPTRQEPLQRHDLYTADEAFLTCTASEIVPIRSVDDRPIGPPGPITTALQEIFTRVVRGREPKYDHMLDYVVPQ